VTDPRRDRVRTEMDSKDAKKFREIVTRGDA